MTWGIPSIRKIFKFSAYQFMFNIINNSLIMVGVSTYWQRAVIGILILVSTSITALQDRRSAARLLKRA